MLNGRVVLFGILCILFVAAAFGQDPSDPNVIRVTEEIDLRELNTTVKELSRTVGELSKTVEELSKTVGELKTTVNRIDERTQGIAKVQHVILASIIGPLVVAIIAPIVYYILTQKIINRPSKSETASTNPVQMNAGETVPATTSPSGFSDEEKLLEQLKNYSPATKEKA